MAYTTRTARPGHLGTFDTQAELSSGHPATSYEPGITAYCVDVGMVTCTGSIWNINNAPVSVSLSSASYGLIGDNSTDNDAAFLAWIAAGQALVTAGSRVQYSLQPGVYRLSGVGYRFPGAADVRFHNARCTATGSSNTSAFITHGDFGSSTSGSSIDIDVLNAGTGSQYHNRNFVGFRALNRTGAYIRLRNAEGFHTGLQLAADNLCAYNTIDVGTITACRNFIELSSLTVGTPFVSENVFKGGNIIATSGAAKFGSLFGLAISTEYDTGYHANSANVWYKPSFQLAAPGQTWAATTGGQTAGSLFYMPTSGSEWLCKVGGVTGSTEPSIIPSVVAGTRVDLTSIVTVAGNAQITVSSTTGISAGWHMRGTNPLSNFPFDTYVVSVDDATHLTMSNTAASSSSLYRAYFTAPVTDGAATWVYVGPYRRSVLWHRDCGTATAIYDARREGGTGEAFIASGPHCWPSSAITAGAPSANAEITLESVTFTSVKDVRCPTWAAATAYLTGDCVRPAVLGSFYWECLVSGTSGGSEPTPTSNVAGGTITDNTATWIIRATRDSSTFGDFGNYSGVNVAAVQKIRNMNSYAEGNLASVGNAHMRAIGSASGWNVQGYCKYVSGTLSKTFAAADMSLARDGLLISNITIGFLVNTEKHKLFRFGKILGTYQSQRANIVAYDKAYNKADVRTSQADYRQRLEAAPMSLDAAFKFADPNDNVTAPQNFMVGDNVPWVFVSVFRGSTGTPVACTFKGLSVQALSFNSYEPFPMTSQTMTPFENADVPSPRSSAGTPTSGFFKYAGEYIVNSSTTDGASVKGWYVKTAGILAPTWLTSTAYVKGQLVVGNSGADLNRVFASNGSFTSGTAPTGTTVNQVDGTATGITSGDIASWDYMGVLAVLTPDTDTAALFSAGNTSTAPVPNCQNGLRQQWTHSANCTFGVPTNPPTVGSMLSILLTSSGSFTLAWNATYRNAPGGLSSTNGQKATFVFMYDGTNWQYVGGSTAFA